MNSYIKHSVRFIFFVLIQGFVFNQLEIGWGIHLMVYPLFIALLPFDLGVIAIMFIAFAMGLAIDAISNTYGLHTSALVLMAYLRPIIYKAFSPRDGYDALKEANIFEMGRRWFILAFGSLLIIHHFWFFLIEIFKLNEFFFTLRKLILSAPLSFIFCILLQFLFIKQQRNNAS